MYRFAYVSFVRSQCSFCRLSFWRSFTIALLYALLSGAVAVASTVCVSVPVCVCIIYIISATSFLFNKNSQHTRRYFVRIFLFFHSFTAFFHSVVVVVLLVCCYYYCYYLYFFSWIFNVSWSNWLPHKIHTLSLVMMLVVWFYFGRKRTNLLKKNLFFLSQCVYYRSVYLFLSQSRLFNNVICFVYRLFLLSSSSSSSSSSLFSYIADVVVDGNFFTIRFFFSSTSLFFLNSTSFLME